MEEPLPYRDLLAHYQKSRARDPENVPSDMPEFYRQLNALTGSRAYDEGLVDNPVRRFASGYDSAWRATGVPGAAKGFGEQLNEMLPQAIRPEGEWSKVLPNAAEQVTNFIPDLLVSGGLQLAGVPMPIGFGLTAATRTYGETGSALQSAVAGGAAAASFGAAGLARDPILKAVGAPALREAAVMTTGAGQRAAQALGTVGATQGKEAMLKVGMSRAPATFGQWLATEVGTNTAANLASMTGDALNKYIQTGGEQWAPTGPELVTNILGEVPYSLYAAGKHGRRPISEEAKSIVEQGKKNFEKNYKKSLETLGVDLAPDDVYVAFNRALQRAGIGREATILHSMENEASVDPDYALNLMEDSRRAGQAEKDRQKDLALTLAIKGEAVDVSKLADFEREKYEQLNLADKSSLNDANLERLAELENKAKVTGEVNPEVSRRVAEISGSPMERGTDQSTRNIIERYQNFRWLTEFNSKKRKEQAGQQELEAQLSPVDLEREASIRQQIVEREDAGMNADDLYAQLSENETDLPTTEPGQTSDYEQLQARQTANAQRAALVYDPSKDPSLKGLRRDPESTNVDWTNPEERKAFERYIYKTMSQAEVEESRNRAGEDTVGKFATQQEAKDNATFLSSEGDKESGFVYKASKKPGKDGMYSVKRYSNYRVTSLIEGWKQDVDSGGNMDFDEYMKSILEGEESGGATRAPEDKFQAHMDRLDKVKVPAQREALYTALTRNVLDASTKIPAERVAKITGSRKNPGNVIGRRLVRYLQFLNDGGQIPLEREKTPKQEVLGVFESELEAKQFLQTLGVSDDIFSAAKDFSGAESAYSGVTIEYDGRDFGYAVLKNNPKEEVKTIRAKKQKLVAGQKSDLQKLNEYLGPELGFAQPSDLNKRRGSEMNFFEQMHALGAEVSKLFEDPNNFFERPPGDFGFDVGVIEGESGPMTAHGALKYPQAKAGKVFKTAYEVRGTRKIFEHKGGSSPILSLLSTLRKERGTVDAGVIADLLLALPDADVSPDLKVGLTLLTKRAGAQRVKFGVALARHKAGAWDSTVRGWYHYMDDIMRGTGGMLSPFWQDQKTGRMHWLAPDQLAAVMVHELTHANTSIGLLKNPEFRAEVKVVHDYVREKYLEQKKTSEMLNLPFRSLLGLEDRPDGVDEFFAEMWTNPELRKFVWSLKDDPELFGALPERTVAQTNIFHRFWNSIKKWMKGAMGTEATSLADRVQMMQERAIMLQDQMGQVNNAGVDVYDTLSSVIYQPGDLVVSRQPQAVPRGEGITPVVGGFEGGAVVRPSETSSDIVANQSLTKTSSLSEEEALRIAAESERTSKLQQEAEARGEVYFEPTQRTPDITGSSLTPEQIDKASGPKGMGPHPAGGQPRPATPEEQTRFKGTTLESRVVNDPIPAFRTMEKDADTVDRVGDFVRFRFHSPAQMEKFKDDWGDAFGAFVSGVGTEDLPHDPEHYVYKDNENWRTKGNEIFISVKSILEADGHDTDTPLFQGMEDILPGVPEQEQAGINYRKSEGFLPDDYNKQFDDFYNAGRKRIFGNTLESRVNPDTVRQALRYGATTWQDNPDGSWEFTPQSAQGGFLGWWGLEAGKDYQDNGERVVLTPQGQEKLVGILDSEAARQTAGRITRELPQFVSGFQTLQQTYERAGYTTRKAQQMATLMSRYLMAWGSPGKYVLGDTPDMAARGKAFTDPEAQGQHAALNTQYLGDLDPAALNRFVKDTVLHESFHLADFQSKLEAYAKTLTDEDRSQILRAVLEVAQFDRSLYGNIFSATTKPREFTAELSSKMYQGLVNSANPSVVLRDYLMYTDDQVAQQVADQMTTQYESISQFFEAMPNSAVANKAAKALNLAKDLMRPVKEVERLTTQGLQMRWLYPEHYYDYVQEMRKFNGHREDYRMAQSDPTILMSRVPAEHEIRDYLAVPNQKVSWWNKTLTRFNLLAEQYPALKPVWDSINVANQLAHESTVRIQSVLLGRTAVIGVNPRGINKDVRRFLKSDEMQKTMSKIALELQILGEAGAVPTPEQRDTLLRRYTTDPEERRIINHVVQATLEQNKLVSQMITRGHRARAEGAVALMARAYMKGGLNVEQARQFAQKVFASFEASVNGDIATAQRLQSEVGTMIPNVKALGDLYETAQNLFAQYDEAGQLSGGLLFERQFLAQRGDWWMTERRFGDYGLYYRNEKGDIESMWFKDAEDRDKFAVGKRDTRFVNNDGDGKNLGLNTGLLERLSQADARVVEKVREALGQTEDGEWVADELGLTVDLSNELRAAMLAQDVSNTSIRRRHAPGREYLSMYDNQRMYHAATVNAIKNQQMKMEVALALTDPIFDKQPQLKELAKQHLQNTLQPDTEWGRRIQTANFTYFLMGNISNMVLEPFQQLMSLAPALIEKGDGLKSAYIRLAKANTDVLAARLGKRYSDPGLQGALLDAQTRGVIDSGLLAELDYHPDLNYVNSLRALDGRREYSMFDMIKNKAYLAATLGRQFYGIMPKFNGEVAFVAAYRQEYKRSHDPKLAAEFATNIVQQSMFGGGKAARPVGIFTGSGKMARTLAQAMYSLQSYGTSMMTLMGYYAKKSFNTAGMAPAQTTQIRKAAMAMWGTQLAFAGVLGLPFVQGMLATLEKFIPGVNMDEEIKDFLAYWLGEDKELGGFISDFMMKGMPSAIDYGWDMGPRFALGGTLGVSPYTGAGIENLLGPTTSLGTNMVRAGQKAALGQPWEAAKQAMPKGFKRLIEAAEQGKEYRNTQGELLLNDMSGSERLGRAVGFTPNRAARVEDAKRQAGVSKKARDVRTQRDVDRWADMWMKGKAEQVRDEVKTREKSSNGQESARNLIGSIARRVEQVTMLQDPRELGTRQTAESTENLLRLMQENGQAMPTQMQRLKKRDEVSRSLGAPPASLERMGHASALDRLMQMNPMLTRVRAQMMLDRLG